MNKIKTDPGFTVVRFEQLLSVVAASACVTPELVVVSMVTFVFQHVGTPGERLSTYGTLVGLDTAVRDYVRFQLIWSIKLLHATWKHKRDLPYDSLQ